MRNKPYIKTVKRKKRKQVSRDPRPFYKQVVYWVGVVHGSLLIGMGWVWYLNHSVRVSEFFFNLCNNVIRLNPILPL